MANRPLITRAEASSTEQQHHVQDTVQIRFGTSGYSKMPPGFELKEALTAKRLVPDPLYLSYHPNEESIAQDVVDTLTASGLAVIKRNWGIQPNLSMARQNEFISQNTRHAIALISPMYTQNTANNLPIIQTTLDELYALHQRGINSGSLSGQPGASYLYPLIMTKGNSGSTPSYLRPLPTWQNVDPNDEGFLTTIWKIARSLINID